MTHPDTPATDTGATDAPSGDAAAPLREAVWITTPDAAPPAGQRPAYRFRRVVELPAAPGRATLTVTAHGVYEAFVDGMRLGDQELTPGITSYRRTLHVQQYDMTALVHAGANELVLVVSDGWYRGRTGAHRVPDGFGTDIGVIAALEVDGRVVAVTDTGWQVGAGEIIAADLMDGQTTDLRRIGQTPWAPAVAATDPLTADRERLRFSPAPPVRVCERFAPASITRLPSGRQIVDFGQNLNGRVRLGALGPAGTRVTLTHGEALDAAGDLTLGHLDITVAPGLPTLGVGQVDTVISRGEPGDVFEPRHTSHGFRYVAVDGLAADLHRDDIAAHQVRTDLDHLGTFAASDERLNALHRIAVASWRANTLDIPTDCPQRERWGYTGDFQIFARSAAFLDDISGFARKWLTSLADDQHPNGMITNVAPNTGIDPEPVIPISFDGSAGWGDAATIVPWELYRATGDRAVLAEVLPMMRRWVDYAARAAADGRHATRVARSPEPAPHERYLWDTGWHWGEWLEPDTPFDPAGDPGIVATAYLAHSARLVSRAADVLGDAAAAEHYGELADRVTQAWCAEFLRADGTLMVPTQANYTRALAFELLPAEVRPVAADHLVRLVEENGGHLSTGFLSTGMLLPVLADAGYPEVAYRVLFQEDEPGWLVMLARGATTVWESWSGIDADGVAHESLNHYSKGAVIAFLHEYVAGIRPAEPGYRRILIQPVVDARLEWAEGSRISPQGEIRARWERDGDRVIVTATVPPGSTAEVVLPDGGRHEAGPGAHRFSSGLPPASSRTPYPARPKAVAAAAAPAAPAEELAWGRIDPAVTTLGELLDDQAARAVIDEVVPDLAANPMIAMARPVPLDTFFELAAAALPPEAAVMLRRRLAALE